MESWPLLTYSGNGESKERGSERYKMVDPTACLEFPPLYIAGTGKQRNEDTCMTNPALAQVPQQRNGVKHSPYTTHSINTPMTAADV